MKKSNATLKNDILEYLWLAHCEVHEEIIDKEHWNNVAGLHQAQKIIN